MAIAGYIVADGSGERWRMWGQSGPEWTADRSGALQFVRRQDAEAFAAEDLDAWLIQEVEGYEIGWLIETANTEYWTGRALDRTGFSKDHKNAVRFARELDARLVLDRLFAPDLQFALRVVEHAWVPK